MSAPDVHVGALRTEPRTTTDAGGNGSKPAPPERKGRPIEAKFRGRCAACKGPINVGTLIVYDAKSRTAAHWRCV